ncbi:MAG TPA: tRNA 2-thiouridine(34) synthase MnmA [Acidimicrobiales bacterium]|nr:tRNA 2-thiouridine(34) synthase MnmA [Acidimicrobiales bacterium]
MRVLVAMSGGVDSSVAAALLLAGGHEVVGATMKLWGGSSDTGCCSVADVEDARRVCQQLGVDHYVFNFTTEFERDVVVPYVEAHKRAMTPNPCISCNAHLKFDRFLDRAMALGFDAIATGHHARAVRSASGAWRLLRGRDTAKDQSYVLYMLGQRELAHLVLPIGELTKQRVRDFASEHGLRTATKPDSQDVCFISRAGGREGFLGDRMSLHRGRLVAKSGEDVGSVGALEVVTVGQRRGLGLEGSVRPERRYVVHVDLEGRAATLGSIEDLLVREVDIFGASWSFHEPAPGSRVQAQLSAHGRPVDITWQPGVVHFDEPVRRVAPGQAVVLYETSADGDAVIGGGTAR